MLSVYMCIETRFEISGGYGCEEPENLISSIATLINGVTLMGDYDGQLSIVTNCW